MTTDPVSVLLIGLDEAVATSLASDEGVDVTRQPTLDGPLGAEPDVIVLALDGAGPLEAIRAARSVAPDAAIVVVTDADRAADGAIALHAGAEDHLVLDEAFLLLLPRAVRYAVTMRRMRRELATVDEVTGLPNLRGFAPIAEHHLRLADRGSDPVVFVFVRLDDHAQRWREEGPEAAESLARDAASVVLEAVRDADVPARIAPDTLCVLLTGAAAGAETFVLSRLVEAMAVHDARLPRPRSLALSVGTARYEPGTGARLSEILETAVRGLSART